MDLEEIQRHYQETREEIESRLEDFRELREGTEFRWFKELCFVIYSSQTEARNAWEAAEELDRKGLLVDGSQQEIEKVLASEGVSYEKQKAEYTVENRKELSQPTLQNPTRELRIKERLDLENPEKARLWLDDSLKGIGMKGASHFLRNVGYGEEFAILSAHLLTSLAELGYLKDSAPPESREEYIEKEEKLKQLSDDLGIDPGALDLVLWSMKTGEIFK